MLRLGRFQKVEAPNPVHYTGGSGEPFSNLEPIWNRFGTDLEPIWNRSGGGVLYGPPGTGQDPILGLISSSFATDLEPTPHFYGNMGSLSAGLRTTNGVCLVLFLGGERGVPAISGSVGDAARCASCMCMVACA